MPPRRKQVKANNPTSKRNTRSTKKETTKLQDSNIQLSEEGLETQEIFNNNDSISIQEKDNNVTCVIKQNLESESLSKSNDNDNNKLESSFISLLSEKIKSGDLEHALKLLSKKKLKEIGPFRLDLSSIRSYEDEQPGLNQLSPTINQFPKNYYNLDSNEDEHPKISHRDLITKNKVNKKTRFQEIIINNQVQTDKFKTTQGNINDQQVQLNKNGKHYNNDDDVCEDISWQKNKDCHLSSETSAIGLTREHLSNNKEVIGITSEHVSDMCDEMKVMFMRSRNPGSDAVTDVAKILLPEQGKNTETIKFLKGRGLEYMAQHRSRFNSDLSFYAEEYIKINSIDSVPSEDEISLYITNDFFKDIFFTQLAIIKQEELFETPTIINPLKKFLKEAFLLHLKYEITRSNNPNMDNYYTLQQVKELDHLTNDSSIFLLFLSGPLSVT
ncbi:hypothetical protein RhiirA4_516426 [Rhizophagus irregularis]|uniref:Uncharacterized protein n=1 Tax=Rhizophagus irregularis TaxID=588596 RepID=A0A2I1GFB2_9GLOM|nr:hypothetical protein RhiirA4_516426 [Rhizophagus irregularis]